MTVPERVRNLIEPLIDEAGLDLYDLDYTGGVLRVVVDQRPVEHTALGPDLPSGADAPQGVGLDDLTGLTRTISRALDEADPIDGRFKLEVSSPGLERTLRTPAHFAGALGQTVAVKTVAADGAERRLRGRLDEADDDGIVVVPDDDPEQSRRLAYGDIERARTVFEWGPAPKPGGPSRRNTKRTPSVGASSSKSRPTKKVKAS
jgi:ribosome maturation factor RimP